MATSSWADDPKNLYVSALRVSANLPLRKRVQFLELARFVEWGRRMKSSRGDVCSTQGCLDERLMEHETGHFTCPVHAAPHQGQTAYRAERSRELPNAGSFHTAQES